MINLLGLDDVDVAIIEALQKDARIRFNELAQEVNLSIPSVSERVRKLEEHGIIASYHAVLDPKKVGKDVTVFITVTVDSSKHYASFIEHARVTDEILEIHSITGSGTHLLKIRTENTSSLEKLLSKIQAWAGVTNTTTSVVLSSFKETTRLKITKHK